MDGRQDSGSKSGNNKRREGASSTAHGSASENENTQEKSERDGREEKEGLPSLGEALKKVFTAGVSAAFMTEESVRAYLADLKLPKEALNLLLAGAAKTKEEIAGRVTQEMVGMLKKADVAKEVSEFLRTHKFKVSAEIEILKKQD